MKKIFYCSCVSLACLSGFAMNLSAAWNVNGQIVDTNRKNHTITVRGINTPDVVQIFPFTELTGKNCGDMGNDLVGSFSDLKEGIFIEADAYPANKPLPSDYPQNLKIDKSANFVAKKIEWQCRPLY